MTSHVTMLCQVGDFEDGLKALLTVYPGDAASFGLQADPKDLYMWRAAIDHAIEEYETAMAAADEAGIRS